MSPVTVRRAAMADLPAIRELILNSYLAMTDYCPQLEAMWTKSAKKAWETPQGDLHDESFPLYLADYSTSPPTPMQETSGTGGTASTAGGLAVDPAKESAFWVAEVDGAVLGCVGLNERHYEDADLLRMAVSPASRGMGIGQLLVAQLESYAISRNIVRLHCITANLAAGRFYVDKCGYFVVQKHAWHIDNGPEERGDIQGQSFSKHLGERLVKSVVVIGGTHGNERLGVELCRQWGGGEGGEAKEAARELRRDTFKTQVVLGNPAAVAADCRYIDHDLNRQFAEAPFVFPLAATAGSDIGGATTSTTSNVKLGADRPSLEKQRAAELRKLLSAADFTIDHHSTSANCGVVVMIPGGKQDPLAVRLAWTLQQTRPDLKVTFSKGGKKAAWSADSVTPSGLSFELGPVPHGTVDQGLLEELRQLTIQSLDYIDTRNKELLDLQEGRDGVCKAGNIVWLPRGNAAAEGSLAKDIIRQPLPVPLPPLVVYEMVQYLKFPDVANMTFIVHPSLLGRDWEELTEGTALFVNNSTCEVITYDKKQHLESFASDATDPLNKPPKPLYMMFIAEPAYTRDGIALALYERLEKTVF